MKNGLRRLKSCIFNANYSLRGLHQFVRSTSLGTRLRPFSREDFSRFSRNISSVAFSNHEVDTRKNNSKKKFNVLASKENILYLDLEDILKEMNLTLEDIRISDDEIQTFKSQMNGKKKVLDDVEITHQTTEGDGIAVVLKQSYLENPDTSMGRFTILKIPKTVVGDKVMVILGKHYQFYADALPMIVRNSKRSLRRDSLVVCPYFSSCSGCQYQMVPYEEQLSIKRAVIKKMYSYFYPEIRDSFDRDFDLSVIGSPKQYSYRTKITPHYKYNASEVLNSLPLKIGFNNVDASKGVVDIDFCAIASLPINASLKNVKEKTRDAILSETYDNEKNKTKDAKKGRLRKRMGTLSLRDSMNINPYTGLFHRECVDSYKSIITEKIGKFLFQYPANEFFQNNNDILPLLLDYMKHHLHLNGRTPNYLIDTYCGSGFFSISLSNEVRLGGKIIGIEVSKASVRHATQNASLNGLAVPEDIVFIEGQSDSLFTNKEFKELEAEGENSVLIMDPSRKGSNKQFLEQILQFRPSMIFYVSCNVATQARDLRMLHYLQDSFGVQYRIREVCGFDFFPQTKHIESVAILEIVK